MSPLGVVLIVSGLAVAAVITLAIWLMDRDDRDDPFAQSGLLVDAATVADLGPMPPEIAHDDPFTPLTPVAHPPAGIPPDRPTGPRAAAAALPAPVAPPLPQDIATHPEHYPFTAWLDDEVAEAGHAIQGSTP